MNSYETVFLQSNKISEEQRKSILEKITKLITINGIIEKIEELGEKKLAYVIRKHEKAFYYVIYFKSKGEFISELERNLRITDEVLKFMTVKVSE